MVSIKTLSLNHAHCFHLYYELKRLKSIFVQLVWGQNHTFWGRPHTFYVAGLFMAEAGLLGIANCVQEALYRSPQLHVHFINSTDGSVFVVHNCSNSNVIALSLCLPRDIQTLFLYLCFFGFTLSFCHPPTFWSSPSFLVHPPLSLFVPPSALTPHSILLLSRPLGKLDVLFLGSPHPTLCYKWIKFVVHRFTSNHDRLRGMPSDGKSGAHVQLLLQLFWPRVTCFESVSKSLFKEMFPKKLIAINKIILFKPPLTSVLRRDTLKSNKYWQKKFQIVQLLPHEPPMCGN